MVLEVLISQGPDRIRKVNSEFVSRGLNVQAGTIIQVSVRKEELDREVLLLQGRQGGGKVISVEFAGTTGDRPLARIAIQRGNEEYLIEQSIEPVYGVEVGDELWIAYDEHSREAFIVNYAVN
jgi:ribosomal 50S subunit-recycling heat shock protein